MPKKFTLTIVADIDGVHFDSVNEGFNALEILGVLEAKKQDILNQFHGSYKRIVRQDGMEMEIKDETLD